MANSQNQWARYDLWDERHLSLDRFAVEDPENGFCASGSPHDPKPSLVIKDGRIIEMDGVPAAEFDMIDEFIARHYFDLTIADELEPLAPRYPFAAIHGGAALRASSVVGKIVEHFQTARPDEGVRRQMI